MIASRTATYLAVCVSVILVLYLLASPAFAKTVVRTGDSVSVAEGQLIEGDFYGAAGTLNFSGNVEGDALLLGGQVNMNGVVAADAFLVGGSVDVGGSVGDDVRVISGEVTISEPIQGDVFVVGGMVNILSTASVAGDVVIFAGQAVIEGSVGGNVLGNIESLRIDAPVAGDVDVTVNNLTFGDKADIEGSVRYVSTQLAVRGQNAEISGELVRSDPIIPATDMDIRATVVPVLILLFSSLAWYLVSRKTLVKVTSRALIKSPRPIMTGFVVILLTPIVIGLLFVSMIGSLVGFFALFSLAALFILSLIGVCAVIGQLMMKLFNQPAAHLSLITVLVGVVGMTLLLLLPIIGQFILVGFTVLTIGAIVDLLLRPEVK